MESIAIYTEAFDADGPLVLEVVETPSFYPARRSNVVRTLDEAGYVLQDFGQYYSDETLSISVVMPSPDQESHLMRLRRDHKQLFMSCRRGTFSCTILTIDDRDGFAGITFQLLEKLQEG